MPCRSRPRARLTTTSRSAVARPPLAVGHHGRIVTKEIEPKVWVASTRFREMNGTVSRIQRRGRTRAKAEGALQDALKEHRGERGAELQPHDTVARAAEMWLARMDALVAEGRRSGTSVDLYRQQLRAVVLPGIGQLRIGECTVGRMDMFFEELSRRPTKRDPSRKLSKSYRDSIRLIVKGILQLAVKHRALPTNPIRDIDPIEGAGPAPARAVTGDERRALLDFMAATDNNPEIAAVQKAARSWDLPDIVTFMLGTGVRIGEALAVRWCDVDLEGQLARGGDGTMVLQPVVHITGNIVRVVGEGLSRNPGKTAAANRTIALPRFLVEMLQRRRDTASCSCTHGCTSGAPDPSEPVFATRGKDGPTWRDPRNVSTKLKDVRKAAGIDWKMTSHAFRKTATTVLHDADLADRATADVIGHAQITTTLDTYVARGQVHPEAAAAQDAAWADS